MNRLMIAALALVTAMLVTGCMPDGAGETAMTGESSEHGEVAAITLVTPSADDAYPSGGNTYPVSPVEALLPTGYPEITVVAPSGEVNPGELSPVAPNLTPQVMPSPGRPGSPMPGLALFTQAVVGELSRQLAVLPADIRVVSAEPVVWPNSGLGCPAEGVDYAQVVVEGSIITLEANGDVYTYHTDGANTYVLCRDGVPVSTGIVPPQ